MVISGAPATENEVVGNFIGTNVLGTSSVGNTNHGLFISGATNNTIGPNNVISGNDLTGLVLIDEASNNRIFGNYIGTDYSGTTSLPNATGVSIFLAPGNFIGGDASEARNIISGNLYEGILIHGATATGNVVRGNFIGTDITGTEPLGNGGNGIRLDILAGPAGSNIIGGLAAGDGNVVSSNNGTGVVVANGSYDNQILGNYIGTDVSGTISLGNSIHGVSIIDSPNNTIGASEIGGRNVISSNGEMGSST